MVKWKRANGSWGYMVVYRVYGFPKVIGLLLKTLNSIPVIGKLQQKPGYYGPVSWQLDYFKCLNNKPESRPEVDITRSWGPYSS